MTQTNLVEYGLSFYYGNGGFHANDPIALTEQQAASISGRRDEGFANVLKELMSYHRSNTSQPHPLERTPIGFISLRRMERLEVMLRKIEPRQIH